MVDQPFFSVIIPTYNPGQYLERLLDSISHNDCLDDIEIVISDDCSTESIDDILVKFPMIKNFYILKNDRHYGFPKNGRQNGAANCHGKWFCFSDQDDYFLEHAFDKMYEIIQSNQCENYIMADFIEEVAETGEQIHHGGKAGWTHGKMYEKTFWDKYHLGYDDLEYCEDINLTNKIDCLITVNDIPIFIKEGDPGYVWYRRSDSLANEDYFIDSMPDYIKATLGVILSYIREYYTDEKLLDALAIKFLGTLLHVYFYYQSDILNSRKDKFYKAVQVLQPMLTEFKNITGHTNYSIIDFMYTAGMQLYNNTRVVDCAQVPFVEKILFKDWLNLYFD